MPERRPSFPVSLVSPDRAVHTGHAGGSAGADVRARTRTRGWPGRAALAGALTTALFVAACSSGPEGSKTTSSDSGAGGGERRPSQPCTSGEITLPIEAFDPNPGEATGKVCNHANVLDEDDSVASLDWAGGETHEIAGRPVTGCVAVEFSEGLTIASVIMKMRPTSSGCGHACTEAEEHGCGSTRDWNLDIFVGQSLSKLEFLQKLSLTKKDLFEYRVSVHKSFAARFAVVCREPDPATADDIAIDWIAALCN